MSIHSFFAHTLGQESYGNAGSCVRVTRKWLEPVGDGEYGTLMVEARCLECGWRKTERHGYYPMSQRKMYEIGPVNSVIEKSGVGKGQGGPQ